MKVGYLTKKRDACYWIRVLSPMSQIVSLGVECREELLERQNYCQKCQTGLYEYQYDAEIPEHFCQNCGHLMEGAEDIQRWKDSLKSLVEWCDVLVVQRYTHMSHLEIVKWAQNLGKPVIGENDDNYIDIPKWNSGHDYYAQRKEIIEACLKQFDHLCVTTKALRDYYFAYNPKITIIRNALDFELIDASPRLPRFEVYNARGQLLTMDQYTNMRNGRKMIAWGGSPTHEKDLEMIVGDLKQLSVREPDIVFGFVGYCHRMIVDVMPADRIFLYGLVPVTQYYSLYKSMDFQVGLAPVVDNEFNRGKSSLKILEYAAVNVFPVASDSVTYQDAIHRGFLARNGTKDWYFRMRKAIGMDEERAVAVAENRKFVERNYSVTDTAHEWIAMFNEVLGARK